MTRMSTATKPYSSEEDMAPVSGISIEDAARLHGSEASCEMGEQSVQQMLRGEHGNEELSVGVARLHDLKDQARSISMPIIGKTDSVGSGSLLQKRAQAARENLRLPSFKSLGIALPHPDHLLTPPDEPDIGLFHPFSLPQQAAAHIPRSAPVVTDFSLASVNQTTPPQDSDAPPQESSINEATTPTVEPAHSVDTMGQDISSITEPALVRQSSSSSEEDTPRGPLWLERAVDAVGRFTFHLLSPNIAFYRRI